MRLNDRESEIKRKNTEFVMSNDGTVMIVC